MDKEVLKFGEISAGEEGCFQKECRSIRTACSGSTARKLDTGKRPGVRRQERGTVIPFGPEAHSQTHMESAVSFRPLEKSDRELVAGHLAEEGGIAADQCFGTLYLWGRSYGLEFAEYGGRFIPRYDNGGTVSFGYPAGKGELAPVIEAMQSWAEGQGMDLKLIGISEKQKEALEKACPGCFSFEENRDNAEYIYEAESLAALAGRKLHGKRNHCTRFEREQPDWHAEDLRPEHVADCIALVERWEAGRSEDEGGMRQAERSALRLAFDGFESLRMDGIILYAGGRPVAFSIGERVGKDCFDVHFEKADVEVNGAYPVVNREFARRLLEKYPDLRLLNREEDMGLENLRKAKESYRPSFLLNKYTAQWSR